VVHYSCLSGGKFLKDRPRFCADCKAGRVRAGQKMPVPPPRPVQPEAPAGDAAVPDTVAVSVSPPPSPLKEEGNSVASGSSAT
jgi:hypothetical protein